MREATQRVRVAAGLFVAIVLVLGCGPQAPEPVVQSGVKPAAEEGQAGLAEQHKAEEPLPGKPITEPEAVSFYTVDHYDLDADPAEQLKATLVRAQAERKRVILQVGGDWCGWCKKLTKYIEETESVNKLLAEHYLLQKVTFDQRNPNEEFLSGYPKISGYPHLFVLSSEGELLHSQDTGKLEQGRGYDEAAVTDFLTKWAGE